MQSQEVILNGITAEDVKQIIAEALETYKGINLQLSYLMVTYLYTFDKADVPFINKYIMEEMRTGDIQVEEEGRIGMEKSENGSMA